MLMLIVTLLTKTSFCQKICNGFRVGGAGDSCETYFSDLTTQCEKLGPYDNPTRSCCNGDRDIRGLNMLTNTCLNSLETGSNIIENKYNYCQQNFLEIVEKSYYAIFVPMNNGKLPSKHEIFRKTLDSDSYEILSGTNETKATRLRQLLKFYKNNNTKIISHESSDIEKFTLGVQAGPVIVGMSFLVCSSGFQDCIEWFGAMGATGVVYIIMKSINDCIGCGNSGIDPTWNSHRVYLTDEQLDDLFQQQDNRMNRIPRTRQLERPPVQNTYQPPKYQPPKYREHDIGDEPAGHESAGGGGREDEKTLKDQLAEAEAAGNDVEEAEIMAEMLAFGDVP